MAKTVIAAEIALDSKQAEQSVGSFRTQLRAATAELVTMSEKFGLSSTEAQNAAKKVAGLKDAIGDAKQLADTFNPDKKFVALGGAIQGVTAGFSAFSGAMGLLGAESKDTEKLLLKVQSAMALQQGLSGISASIDSFKLLASAIKQSTVFQKLNNTATLIATGIQKLFGASVVGTGTAFNVLKGAIIATGIGALVVLLGVVISKMNLFGDETAEAAEAQDKLTAALNKQKEALNESLSNSQAYVDRQIELVQNNEKILDLQARGVGHEKEIAALKKQNINIELESIKVELATKQGLLTTQEELTLKSKEYSLQKQYERIDIELATKASGVLAAKQKEREAERVAALKKFNELKNAKHTEDIADTQAYFDQLAAIENAEAQKDIDRLRTNQENELQAKADLAELALLDDPNSIDNKLMKMQADFDLEMAFFTGTNVQRQIKQKEHEDAMTKLKEDSAATQIALQQNTQQTQLSIASGALGALSDLVGRQTAAGKVMAIAEATINTFKAGLQVFAAPMPGIPPVSLAVKIASMVAAIAGGIVTVKKIVSTKVPGGGAGGSIPTMPSLPAAPLTPQAQTTRLDQQSINQVGNAANRAYVLETDVSGNQERITRLNRAARIN